MNRRELGAAVFGVSLGGLAIKSQAQSKVIRVLIPFNPGSGSDSAGRFYAEKLSTLLGRPVIVENKPGGNGSIAVRALLREPADGNTILLGSNSIICINPLTMKDINYDPFKELTPLHGLSMSAAALVTAVESPITTVQDIKMRFDAGNLMSFGSYSEGYKLLGEWICEELKVNAESVNYKGGSAMITDVVGGRLSFAVSDLSGIVGLANNNRIRVLATTGAKRDKELPNVLTMKEQGFGSVENYVWAAFSMKAGTPAAIVAELADAISKIQNSEAARKFQAGRPGDFLRKSMAELGEFQYQEYLRFKSIRDRLASK